VCHSKTLEQLPFKLRLSGYHLAPMVLPIDVTKELAPLKNADVDKIGVDVHPKLIFLAAQRRLLINPTTTPTSAVERQVPQKVIAEYEKSPDSIPSCHRHALHAPKFFTRYYSR
jgi:hypothetical protein